MRSSQCISLEFPAASLARGRHPHAEQPGGGAGGGAAQPQPGPGGHAGHQGVAGGGDLADTGHGDSVDIV